MVSVILVANGEPVPKVSLLLLTQRDNGTGELFKQIDQVSSA